jgi:hypothetical protein
MQCPFGPDIGSSRLIETLPKGGDGRRGVAGIENSPYCNGIDGLKNDSGFWPTEGLSCFIPCTRIKITNTLEKEENGKDYF